MMFGPGGNPVTRARGCYAGSFFDPDNGVAFVGEYGLLNMGRKADFYRRPSAVSALW
jgi:hypothetical protein